MKILADILNVFQLRSLDISLLRSFLFEPIEQFVTAHVLKTDFVTRKLNLKVQLWFQTRFPFSNISPQKSLFSRIRFDFFQAEIFLDFLRMSKNVFYDYSGGWL